MNQASNKKLYKNQFTSRKDRFLYYFVWYSILILWIGAITFSYWLWIFLQWENTNNTLQPIVVKIFICLNFIFNSLFYCNSMRDLVYGLYYNLYVKRQISKEKIEWNKKYQKSNINAKNYIVYVLYCTCDDFDEDSLIASMKQEYKKCKYFILDDSKKEISKNKIDEFAKKYKNVQVIRRDTNKGFKAGNINHFLKQDKNYDFFVVLDADEIIPSDFVGKALLYFLEDSQIGIVQAKNLCTRQKNLFDYIGSYIHNFQWQVEYNTRNRIGVTNLSGHGAMIKKECYEEVDGFPEIISEDWGITFKALKNKFIVVYANNIVCYEEFPSQYNSFKKRQFRWSQGGVECLKLVSFNFIFYSKIPFFRKLDVMLSQIFFMITMGSILLIIFNLTILSPLEFSYTVDLWWYSVIMVFFAIVPLLNCFIFYFGKINFFKLIVIILFFYFIYASLLISTLFAIVSGFIKTKLKFIITPKNITNNRISFKDSILSNILEIITAILIITATILIICFTKVNFWSLAWIILIAMPLLLGVVYSQFSNVKISKKQKLSMVKNYSNPKLFV